VFGVVFFGFLAGHFRLLSAIAIKRSGRHYSQSAHPMPVFSGCLKRQYRFLPQQPALLAGATPKAA
jgi:hypothetical protein